MAAAEATRAKNLKIVSVKSKLQTKQTTIILNLEEAVFSKINEFSKKDYVSTDVEFCGRTLSVLFYPKGKGSTTVANSTAMHCRLTKPVKRDVDGAVPLKMTVVMRFGSLRKRWENVIERFEKGWGSSNFHSLQYFRDNPTMTITATMYFNHDVVVPHKYDFFTQCKSMSALSQGYGDITLQLRIRTDEDEEQEEFTEPPQKKRKLNMDPTANEQNKVAPRRSKRLQNKDASLSEDENNEGVDNTGSFSSKSREVSHMAEVKVSSILLKAASPVFARMLENNMRESQERKITVYTDSVSAVHEMLHFLWTNELVAVNCDRENRGENQWIFNLLRLAHYYELEALKISCINRLIRELSVNNFVDVVNTLNQYSMKEGMNAVIAFANKNRGRIVAHGRCNELPFMFQMTVLNMGK